MLNFSDSVVIGTVVQVDTSTVVINVEDYENLKLMQVNRLVCLFTSRSNDYLIGLVQKIQSSISNTIEDKETNENDQETSANQNTVKILLVGTYLNDDKITTNRFSRNLQIVPEIAANCYRLEENNLSIFMQSISGEKQDDHSITAFRLGCYSLDEEAVAFINGNKFYQRHALIVGSTGSGKSWTTASLIEKIATLSDANAIVFDIHGEYSTLESDNISLFRIATPTDCQDSNAGLDTGVINLPYWLMSHEALKVLFIDKKGDSNAPNQIMNLSKAVYEARNAMLTTNKPKNLVDFTSDSPIPFSVKDVITKLKNLNTEMVLGSNNKDKQGPYFGMLTRMIDRMENKISDRRLSFMFSEKDNINCFDFLIQLSKTLIDSKLSQNQNKPGVKIIDFSEVPSDILPLIVSMVARLVFTLYQWTDNEKRQPMALFLDEAHLYIPDRSISDSADEVALTVFERIAKEGRKYGVGLVVISQRPSEVNKTILSQCNNVIAMRLTNAEDQTVVRKLLPDSLGNLSDVLPILDIGEALVVGDASLLPSRIRIDEPQKKPNSGTINFWTKWSQSQPSSDVDKSVWNWLRQSTR